MSTRSITASSGNLFSAPFVLGGTLKIVYDVLIWLTFRKVTLRE